jgi:hypothetical protein
MAKTKSAGSYTQASANSLREKAVLLRARERGSQLETASVIYDLYYGDVEIGKGFMPLWKFFGYDSWFDYVETEVGMHVSTAAGYRMVHDVFMVRLKGKWDPEIMPSFTKLKALTRVVDAKSVNSWFRRANSVSCCLLEEEVLEHLYGKKKSGANRHFTALLTDRQITSVNSIIEIGRKEFPELESRGDILTKILEQWDAAVAKRTRRSGTPKLTLLVTGKKKAV